MSRNSTDAELQDLLRSDDKKALETIYIAYKEEFLNYACVQCYRHLPGCYYSHAS